MCIYSFLRAQNVYTHVVAVIRVDYRRSPDGAYEILSRKLIKSDHWIQCCYTN